MPTLFIAGDSTAANGTPDAIGWGRMFADYFDPARMRVVNRAIGGRSSRTFVSEGRWDRLMEEVKAGDFVIIQFGHNDGGPIDSPPARGSLPGLGEETREVTVNGRQEIVHTFGWYLRKMISDTRAKGATPILASLTVRNFWKDGRVERGSGRFGAWTREVAEAEKVAFIDLTKLIADRYDQMGPVEVNSFFPRDHVHTSWDGARFNARLMVSGLKGLREQSIIRGLSREGRSLPTAEPENVWVPPRSRPRGSQEAFETWLNLGQPADPDLPTIYLIGDSTVRTGRGTGDNGQFGWGDPFENYIYPGKANLVNLAVGGTGARTFMQHWTRIEPRLKRGDVVIMQFGHNDNGARGALRGIGEETEERENPESGETEVVHTFGWYLRKYIADTRARGATPVVCSLIPRNLWRDGRIARTADGHAAWARAVAEAENVTFLDLHELIAQRYEAMGQEAVNDLFADGRVHTNWKGAVLNAEVVASALRESAVNPLQAFMRPGPRR
ncbi:MAG TPA: GDSL family lipase [Verrucomicrobia bacterium]|nr:GDSL family lipase [Verrucomicrobiota bacterium]HOP97193.1 GDSL-type esterase/lipase family protein [Verrucomicrobiota bacterium]HPU55198.1 GDSL-type esterase/lipase family protein [Verrucomicrobiota bacterium]